MVDAMSSLSRLYGGGTTTLHLQHEANLLICLFILTSASLCSMYRDSFVTIGDLRLILALTLWQGRHLAFRALCCNCNWCCSHNRTVLSHVAEFLARHCSAGQYFDAPDHRTVAHLATQDGGGGDGSAGGGHHHDDHHHHRGGGGGSHHASSSSSSSSSFASSALHDYAVVPAIRFGLFVAAARASPRPWDALVGAVGPSSYGSTSLSSSSSNHDRSRPPGRSSKQQQRHNQHQQQSVSGGGAHRRRRASTLREIRSTRTYRRIESWWEHMPSAQLLFNVVALIACVVVLYSSHRTSPAPFRHHGHAAPPSSSSSIYHAPSSSPSSRGHRRRSGAHHHHGGNSGKHHSRHKAGSGASDPVSFEHGGDPYHGFSRHHDHPHTILGLLASVAAGATLVTLLVYGRVLVPIPDLTSADGNVYRAVKAETRRVRGIFSGGGSSGGGSSGNYGGNSGGGGKSSRSSSSKNNNASNSDHHHHGHSPRSLSSFPWAERRYHSITEDNRFRCWFRATALRVVEHVVTCAIVPRTRAACAATGRCRPTPSLWEVSPLLAGAGAFYDDDHDGHGNDGIRSLFDTIRPDALVGAAVLVTVALVTVSSFAARAVLLDRTYLSTLGWLVDGGSDGGGDGSTTTTTTTRERPTTDSGGNSGGGGGRHQGRKGGRGKNSHNNHHHNQQQQQHHQNDHHAAVNDRAVDFVDPASRAAQRLFRYELGGSNDSSTIVSAISKIHAYHGLLLLNFSVAYWVMDRNGGGGGDFTALSLVFLGNLCSACGALKIGLTDHNEIQAIAARVNS